MFTVGSDCWVCLLLQEYKVGRAQPGLMAFPTLGANEERGTKRAKMPVLGMQRQGALCEFKTDLVYIVRSGTAKAT